MEYSPTFPFVAVCAVTVWIFFFFFFIFFFFFSVHIFPLEMYKNIKNEKLKVLQSVSIQLLCGVTPNCIQFF